MVSTDHTFEPAPVELAGWGLADHGEVSAYADVQGLNDTLATTGEILIPRIGDVRPISPGESQVTVKVGETVLGVSLTPDNDYLLQSDLLPEERKAIEQKIVQSGTLVIKSYTLSGDNGYQPDGKFVRSITPDSGQSADQVVYPIRGSFDDDHEIEFKLVEGTNLSIVLHSNNIDTAREDVQNPGNSDVRSEIQATVEEECSRVVQEYGIEVDVYEVLVDE